MFSKMPNRGIAKAVSLSREIQRCPLRRAPLTRSAGRKLNGPTVLVRDRWKVPRCC